MQDSYRLFLLKSDFTSLDSALTDVTTTFLISFFFGLRYSMII